MEEWPIYSSTRYNLITLLNNYHFLQTTHACSYLDLLVKDNETFHIEQSSGDDTPIVNPKVPGTKGEVIYQIQMGLPWQKIYFARNPTCS